MKSLSRIGTLCLLACSLAVLATSHPAVAQSSDYDDYDQPGDSLPDYGQPNEDVSIETFEDKLAPHGRWIDTSEYGRVWIPNVDRDFQPYATNGHWVVTEYGNTWISDYDWGWAPFHYGRWYRHSQFGWAWIPGKVWGPAWVSWRSGDGYYGWAPLGPSVSINLNIPLGFWTFVPQAYITSPRIYDYYIPRPRIVNVYRNTTVINNTYRFRNRNYVYGPRRQEIENVTRRRVDVYSIDRLNQPSRSVVTGRTVRIYRPEGGTRVYTPGRARIYNPNSGVENRRFPENRGRIYNPNSDSENRRFPENRGRVYNPNPDGENRRSPETGGRIYNPNPGGENRRFPENRGRIYNPNSDSENRRSPETRGRIYSPNPSGESPIPEDRQPPERPSGGRVWRSR